MERFWVRVFLSDGDAKNPARRLRKACALTIPHKYFSLASKLLAPVHFTPVSKAPEGWRAPRPGGRSSASVIYGAPWTALVLLGGGKRFRRVTAFLLLVWLPTMAAPLKPIAIAVPNRTNEVHFHSEILPLLQANCLPCHNQTRAKANLNLETPTVMIRGGDTGPALVPGKPGESLLLRTAAHEVEDLVMPPADNKANARSLTPEDLGLLSLWISQGGHAEAGEVDVPTWKPIATNWLSSFAMALSPDGHTLAVGRANRIFLQELMTGRLLGQLSDPTLQGAAQRDLVGALAFSPDGTRIAAGGFREVRIWKRQPQPISPAHFSWTNSHAVAVAFSPDGSRLARLTSDAHLEIRLADQTNALMDWPLPKGTDSAAVHWAWTPDNRWLAVTHGSGEIQLISGETNLLAAPFSIGTNISALAWFEDGHSLAATVVGTNHIRRLHRGGTPELPTLEAAGEFSGPAANFSALIGVPSTGQSIIAATTDGVVRRWSADPAVAPQEVKVDGTILALQGVGAGHQVAASLASGGVVLVTCGDKPSVSARIGLNPQVAMAQTNAEFDLSLAKLELARAGRLKSEAEGSKKSSEEALVKAKEKRDGHTKALADQEKELAHQKEIEANATKERDEAAAELDRTAKAFVAADASKQEGLATARLLTEKDAALRAEAMTSVRLRGELERLTAAIPATNSEPSTVRLREALAAAISSAESLERKSADIKAQVAKSLEEIASRAFAAGQRKAEADKAQADLPPRKKQAEERLAAAQKSINDLANPIAKARIALDGSTQDVALAEKNMAKANDALGSASAAEATAKSRIQEAEGRVAAATAEVKRAGSETPKALALSPLYSELLLVDEQARATCWSTDSLTADNPVSIGHGQPLAEASVGDHAFLLAFPEGVFRLETKPVWAVERVIGGSDATGAPGPFIDRVNAVAFSPDGRLLATGGGDPSRAGELKLWKVENGSLVRDFGALHSDCVTAIAFSPRGEWIATGGADRFGRITPVQGDGPRLALEGHTHHVIGVAWLMDGSLLATAGAEGVVKLWNPQTGEKKGNVDGFNKEVTGLQPMGLTSQFVVVSANGNGRVVRGNGEKVRDLKWTPEYLQTIAVTRDGQWAAAADDRGIVSVWNLNTGEVQREVTSSGTPIGF